MRRDNIKKWFETVLACSGSLSLEHFKRTNVAADEAFVDRYSNTPEYADQARAWQPLDDSFYNESFIDNFDQLYKPEIISMVNRYIVSDASGFYLLFDSFVTDIKTHFNLSNDSADKRDLVNYITPQLYTIRMAANRLANALRKIWYTSDDPRFDRAILSQQGNDSSSSFALLITGVQSQIRRQQSENQLSKVEGVMNLDRYKKPDHDYLYLALLLTQKTEECLVNTGWLNSYQSEPVTRVTDVLNPLIANNESDKLLQAVDCEYKPDPGIVHPGESLKDLFADPEYVPIAVNALHSFSDDKPVISLDTRVWQNTRKSKTILAAWLRRLQDTDRIRTIWDKKQLVPLLNEFFSGLHMGEDARTLKSPNPEIVREFAALILPRVHSAT